MRTTAALVVMGRRSVRRGSSTAAVVERHSLAAVTLRRLRSSRCYGLLLQVRSSLRAAKASARCRV